MITTRVAKQQLAILLARMILKDESLDLVVAMKIVYPVVSTHKTVNIKTVMECAGVSRTVAWTALDKLTKANYLLKEHYRAWFLNVEAILRLNDMDKETV